MEFEINDPPTDGITSLSFSPHSAYSSSSSTPPHLLATSWDSSAYVYDCALNLTVGKFPAGAALLDGCFSKRERGVSYVVGLNRQIHRLELKTGTVSNFGSHDDAIKSIVHNEPTGLLFTGSWDRSVGVWDERSNPLSITSRLSLPDKIYSMDVCDDRNLLLVATAGRHIYLYDTRSLGQPLQKRESSLKYQTRCVKFFPADESESGQHGGFICASIEGRVAVDFIDASPEVQQSRYAFKCHRQAQPSSEQQGNMEIVYPVNAVACHPLPDKSVSFFTAGSDGLINSWDRLLRKRIRQFPKYSTGISALAIDPHGSFLAIAASYSFDEGEKDHPSESIFIRKLEDSDIKSRSKQ